MYSADVEEIIRCHRIKAEEKEGFMQDLCSTFYGFNANSELAWSLQDVISGVRVRSRATSDNACNSGDKSQIVAEIERRRCQVRAYVVMINSALYLYSTYEVRLPCWNIDLDATLAAEYALYYNTSVHATNTSTDDEKSSTVSANWSNELENEYCGQGHGRPYNEHRNKGQTERYLLSELSELVGSERAVTECMVELFTKLKPVLQHRQRTYGHCVTPGQEGLGHIFDASAILAALQDASQCETQTASATVVGNRTEVAIVGVDLVLSHSTSIDAVQEHRGAFSAKIVEINNNPAMPAEGKNMSAPYREHLVSFVSGTMALAAAVVRAQRLGQASVVDTSIASQFVSI